MVEVIATDEFVEWFDDLRKPEVKAVSRAVDVLEDKGLSLGYPSSSAIEGSKHPIRELRVQSGGKPIRVFYAFDPMRQAVLLLGGEKGDSRFYERYVPKVEHIWEEYLADQNAGLHGEETGRRKP
ncbi:MAG: type II toxin-antitoxin system RelE/ParE family toxin [Deltaproteobacteria bacterium]|nr:type II toxin-antitoxin system RelE/ParE family toxin [Deltaproteobacteria bacterium]